MKRAKEFVGKRFSRREAERITIDGLDFWLEQIDWNGVFGASTIRRYKTKALEVLSAENIPLERLLEDAPHGSMVLDFVLNHKGLPHDSLPALAAKLLEHALHIEAYQSMPGAMERVVSLAFSFGRLTTLFDVYEIDRCDHAKRRADKPTSDPYDSGRNKRILAFHARLIADGARDANQQTADEFDLSARQVSRIVKPKRT